nr:hypothetical protein [Tanacetum cinerariifolium]
MRKIQRTIDEMPSTLLDGDAGGDLFSNGLEVSTRQILDSKRFIPTKTAADAKVDIQEMAKYSQKWHNGTSRTRRLMKRYMVLRASAPGFCQRNNANPSYQERRQSMEESLSKFMNESAKRHDENSYMIKEIQAFIDAAIRNQRALIKTLEIQIGKMSKELATMKHPNGIAKNVLVEIGDEKIIFKSVKHASSFIKRVYMFSLGERMELDLEARLMGETLILNRSIDPLCGDYIKLNDLHVSLELRRDQVNDLRPTIKEGEVFDKPMIEEVKTRNDDQMVSKIIGYLSYYDQDEKIRIDYAYNLKFSCMIGFELIHTNFFPNFPIDVMSKKFYNSIMKDKIKFRGRNELGNFASVPVFIENFYVITDFIVGEDMDPYLDEGIGDVVVREPFYNASCTESRRFDGNITIRDEDDSVTFQMALSNPRFKHLTKNNAIRSRHY